MSEARCRERAMELISPNETPTPSTASRSVSEGPLRAVASEACRLMTPARRRSLELRDPEERREEIDEAAEKVPFSLARTVVNMQEYYASELEAERQRTEVLARQNQEMNKRLGDLEQRLQMHVVLMDGFVGFMRDVKQGNLSFGFGSAELEIAKAFGGVHLDEVQRLSSANSAAPVQQSVEQQPTNPVTFDVEEEVNETPQPTRQDIFDQLPPTPDLDTAPVRSTGRRAPKRRNPPTRPHREVKRRATANVRSVRLRSRSSWNPINANQAADSDEEQTEEVDDHDYTPDTEVEVEVEDEEEQEDDSDSDDEIEDIPNDPSPSHSDNDFDTSKPRYSVPRSSAPRYAAGPAGRRFKYHKMPKTVALVWQEWKHGSHGNPAIEALEKKYNTSWRLGTLQERKYASNYVGVRQKIVRKVEEMCEEQGISAQRACDVLDKRIDGRMQLLMTALRKGQDPLVVIQRRKK